MPMSFIMSFVHKHGRRDVMWKRCITTTNRPKTLLFSLKLICELRNVFISGCRWLQREMFSNLYVFIKKNWALLSLLRVILSCFLNFICEIKVQLLPIFDWNQLHDRPWVLVKATLRFVNYAFVDRRSRQLFVFVIIDFKCGFVYFFFFGFYLINRPSCFLPYLNWKMSLPC